MGAMSCRGPINIFNSVSDKLGKDRSTFKRVDSSQDKRGDQVDDAFKAWQSNLKSLASEIESVTKLLDKKPKLRKKQEVQDMIDDLQPKVEKILARPVELSYVLPLWLEEGMYKSIDEAEKSILKIDKYFEALTGELPPELGAFDVKLEVDDRLVDTLQLCLNTVRAATVLAPKSQICQDAARKYCTRQTSRSCVLNVLARNIGRSCIETDELTSFDYEAKWLSELSSCHVKTGITRDDPQ